MTDHDHINIQRVGESVLIEGEGLNIMLSRVDAVNIGRVMVHVAMFGPDTLEAPVEEIPET